MAFVLPDGLAPEVYPLAWLVGTWSGVGVVSYPGIDETPVTNDLVVTHDGGPYLSFTSTLRVVEVPDDLAAEGAEPAPVWSTESGFWRIPPQRPADVPADKHPVEVLLTDPAGYVAVLVGTVGSGRIDLVSDLMARTETGAEVSAQSRLYGLVDGELLWVHELAAFGHPLQSYASARLSRVEPPVSE